MPHFPFAYVGPGAGFAFLGSLLSIVVSLLAGIASLLLWPFRAFAGLFRRRVAARVILLEVDGLDPLAVKASMAAGKLPNLARLKEQGAYTELRAASDGWAAAGFWQMLGEHAVDCTVLLVPGTHPVKGFRGRMLYRSAEGQFLSDPPYYAKYLSRLLGPLPEALNDAEALFFTALDHQKRGVVASVFDAQDAADDMDCIAGRLLQYADNHTTILIVVSQSALLSSRKSDGAMDDVGSIVLRIFGIEPPGWREGKPVTHFA